MQNRLKGSEFLLKWLITPFAILTVISLISSFFIVNQNYYITLQGLLLNLGVTFLGIIITISYVNWILNEHENKKWKDVQININDRVKRLLISTTTTFRMHFGFSKDVYSSDFLESFDALDSYSDVSPELCEEIININENILKPVVSSKIRNMNQDEWFRLTKGLEILQKLIVRIIDLFANKIEPNVLADLLRIEDEVEEILNTHHTFPDFYGVPDYKIPASALKNKDRLYGKMEKHVDNIISLTVKLMNELN